MPAAPGGVRVGAAPAARLGGTRAAAAAGRLHRRVLRAVREGDADGPASGVGPKSTPVPLASRRPQVLVGAAAAILVLAGAVGIPLALSHSGSTAASEASRAASDGDTTHVGVERGRREGRSGFLGPGTFGTGPAFSDRAPWLCSRAASTAAPAPTEAPSATTGAKSGRGDRDHAGRRGRHAQPGSAGTTESEKATNGPLDLSAAGPTTRAQIDRCLRRPCGPAAPPDVADRGDSHVQGHPGPGVRVRPRVGCPRVVRSGVGSGDVGVLASARSLVAGRPRRRQGRSTHDGRLTRSDTTRREATASDFRRGSRR